MPMKQAELILYDNCCITQSSFLCFHWASSRIARSVVFQQFFLQWAFSWGFPWWVAVHRKLVWISLYVLPYLPYKAQQFSLSITFAAANAMTVDIIWSGASKWSCQAFSAHINWNCSMSPRLSTAAVIMHLSFPGLLMWL